MPTITGTAGSESLDGTNSDDVIFGFAGNDVINGRGGADILFGGSGADVFAFTFNTDSNEANLDYIADFTSGEDFIFLRYAYLSIVRTDDGSSLLFGSLRDNLASDGRFAIAVIGQSVNGFDIPFNILQEGPGSPLEMVGSNNADGFD